MKEITIFFVKNPLRFECKVIDETKKAYKCHVVRSYIDDFNDKIGSPVNKLLWLPKSVCIPVLDDDILEVKKAFTRNINLRFCKKIPADK